MYISYYTLIGGGPFDHTSRLHHEVPVINLGNVLIKEGDSDPISIEKNHVLQPNETASFIVHYKILEKIANGGNFMWNNVYLITSFQSASFRGEVVIRTSLERRSKTNHF